MLPDDISKPTLKSDGPMPIDIADIVQRLGEVMEHRRVYKVRMLRARRAEKYLLGRLSRWAAVNRPELERLTGRATVEPGPDTL